MCLKKNIKLSPKKMQIGKQVIFGGIQISYDNILEAVNMGSEDSKIAAVKRVEVPKNKKMAQLLLGMINQINMFFSDISKI